MNPCFAIIDRNTLSSLSLKAMLCDIFDQVEVYAYGSMRDFIIDSNRHFVHFFVNEEILFSHPDEFDTLKNQTTVLACGHNPHLDKAGYHQLNVSTSEKELAAAVFNLLETCIGRGHYDNDLPTDNLMPIREDLSPREKEVLRLMVKGLINKEIGEALSISLPTVIFHRNNICAKLGTRSIGRLTIHAVLSGIIEISEI